MTPVLFAYGGWHTSSFLSGEIRDPRKTLPRGLVWSAGVITVYTSVNFVTCARWGPKDWQPQPRQHPRDGRALLGPRGGALIAAGIAFSAFGFLAHPF